MSSCSRSGWVLTGSGVVRGGAGPQTFATAGVLERLSFGRRPRVTRYAVSQVGLERTLDLTAAREQLGYVPGPTTLAGAEGW